MFVQRSFQKVTFSSILCILLALPIAKGYSCSCLTVSIAENYSKSDEVFVGEVIDVYDNFYGADGDKLNSYTIKILSSFKQRVAKETEYRTILSLDNATGGCDFKFEMGEKYLIYGWRQFDVLKTTDCDRTSLLKAVEDNELKELKTLYENDTAPKNDTIIRSSTSHILNLTNGNSSPDEYDKVNYILLTIIVILSTIIIVMILKRRS